MVGLRGLSELVVTVRAVARPGALAADEVRLWELVEAAWELLSCVNSGMFWTLAGCLGWPWIILHFTPTSGSWLNMAEVFFSIITRQAIRRGSFTSVPDLITAIETFINGWNDRCHPFTWTKTADEILSKCRPGKRTSFTRH